VKSSAVSVLLLFLFYFCSPSFAQSNSSDSNVEKQPEQSLDLNWIPAGKEWSQEQMQIVSQALDYIHKNMNKPSIRQCVKNKTIIFSGINASQDRLSEQSWLDYDALSINSWPTITVSGRYANDWWAGLAYLQVNLQGAGSRDNDVWIEDEGGGNEELLESSVFILRKNKAEITVNLRFIQDNINIDRPTLIRKVSGIILHEILHQMGHNHPSNSDPKNDYNQGNFIVVAGDCLDSEGIFARGPSDNQYADRIGNSSGGIDSRWRLD
jgi:hypothetical protein